MDKIFKITIHSLLSKIWTHNYHLKKYLSKFSYSYLENGLGTVNGRFFKSHSLKLAWHLGQVSGNVKANNLCSQCPTQMMSEASDILAGMVIGYQSQFRIFAETKFFYASTVVKGRVFDFFLVCSGCVLSPLYLKVLGSFFARVYTK